MKRENDLTDMFRSRLSDAGMEVREGFWQALEQDLATAEVPRRLPVRSWLPRLAAAASVLLVLGFASATFWYFSTRDEVKEAFTQAAALLPQAELTDTGVQETMPSAYRPIAAKPQPHGKQLPASSLRNASAHTEPTDEETVSVHVSITITQKQYGQTHRQDMPYNPVSHAGTYSSRTTCTEDNEEPTAALPAENDYNAAKWAVKLGLGTSLPGKGYAAPLAAGVYVERRLNKRLSLETGLQYNRLEAGQTLHTLNIPLRLNVLLASSPRWDFYAMAGGAAEKCIAGTGNNSFKAEPVQLSLLAGVGIRYDVNERFALFAEPSVSHHFGTSSSTRTPHTERPTNLNLLCGMRMSF